MSRPRRFLFLSLAAVVVGLAAFLLGWLIWPRHEPPLPESPMVVLTDCRREQDSEFSQQEREIVASARQHLEKARNKSIDAYYRVSRTDDGFSVWVLFVTGYTGNRPLFLPGAHCTVLLRDDGTVIRVLPGA